MIWALHGWRGWTDEQFIHRTIDDMFGHHAMFGPREIPVVVRTTDDEGAAAIVRHYVAGMDGAVLAMYGADWTSHGGSAWSVRDKRMLLGDDLWDPTAGKPADVLVSFPQPGAVWMGRGSRAWNCIGQAHLCAVEVRIPGYWQAEAAS